MNCELVNKNIDELTIVDLNQPIESNLKTHVDSCESCQHALQQQLAYLHRVSTIETPELSAQSAQAMLNKVTHKNTTHENHNSGFLQGFIAASVLAVSIFGAWNVFTQSPEISPLYAIENTQQEFLTTEVTLVINVPEDMYDADLNISLPQHIALEGYDDIQELTWPVDLKAGVNTLSLPIRVNKHLSNGKPLSIMAKLYHYAEEREFEIKVDIDKIQSLQDESALITTGTNVAYSTTKQAPLNNLTVNT